MFLGRRILATDEGKRNRYVSFALSLAWIDHIP
jgi:hypothetical protein